MLLNLFFKIIQSLLLETKTFSSIRDDFLKINVFQKPQKTPQILLLLLQRLSKIIRILFLSFTSVIIQDLQQWNEDTQRILRIHGHAEFFFIFVSLICLLQKKIMWAQKGLPISLMTIILHRTKAVISSITPLYIVKREIKYKKNHPVHRMIYPKQ